MNNLRDAFKNAGITASTFTKPVKPDVCRVVYAPPLPTKRPTRLRLNPKFGEKPKMFEGVARQMERKQQGRLVSSAKLGAKVQVWGLRMQGAYQVGKFDR